MKTLYQYIVALLIAVMAAFAPVPVLAQQVFNIDIANKPERVVAYYADKKLANKVLHNAKKELATLLYDAQSAQYVLAADGDLVLDVQTAEGEENFSIHYGWKVNGKNKLGAFVGFQRICIFTTREGEVMAIGLGEGDKFLIMCSLYIQAITGGI